MYTRNEKDKTEKYKQIDMSTYNSDFLQTNNEKIIQIEICIRTIFLY